MMNIGIFGGSFNPIHSGHAMLASYIAQYCDIDKVWLMVSPQNPLKDGYSKSLDIARLRMAEMVASHCTDVIASGLEFTLPKPSYTINTLDTLASKFPDDRFKLIIGADNWAIFDKWKEHDRIIEEYGVMIYPRRGVDIDTSTLPQNVSYLAEAPMIEISSSWIRGEIKENRNMAFFLPTDVYDFILANSLYK